MKNKTVKKTYVVLSFFLYLFHFYFFFLRKLLLRFFWGWGGGVMSRFIYFQKCLCVCFYFLGRVTFFVLFYFYVNHFLFLFFINNGFFLNSLTLFKKKLPQQHQQKKCKTWQRVSKKRSKMCFLCYTFIGLFNRESYLSKTFSIIQYHAT